MSMSNGFAMREAREVLLPQKLMAKEGCSIFLLVFVPNIDVVKRKEGLIHLGGPGYPLLLKWS